MNDALEDIQRCSRELVGLRMRFKFTNCPLPQVHPSQLPLLAQLSEKGPSTQRQLAERLAVAPSTIAVSLKRMETAGLVVRRADEQDLRSNIVELTDEGARTAAAGREFFDRVAAVQYKGFTEQELLVYCEFLRRMNNNLQKELSEEK